MADAMETEEKPDESPTLFRVRLVGPTWDNRSPVEGEPRIAPQFLEEYEAARRAFMSAFRDATIPQLGKTDRLIPVSQFPANWSNEQDQLYRALKRLDESWDEVVNEARQRLGNAFDEKQYPESSAVFDLFSIELQGLEDDVVSTKRLLGTYSRFTPVPNAAEHVMWGRRIEKERKEAVDADEKLERQ